MTNSSRERWWVLGGGGRLGAALVRRLAGTRQVFSPTRQEVDLADLDRLAAQLGTADFQGVINCAAITSLEACEEHPALARVVNTDAPALLAEVCQARGARFIHISTDYVFPGDGNAPLSEGDPTGPLSIYGSTKLAGEQAVLAACPQALVARVSWLFGPDKPAFPETVVAQARAGGPVMAIHDKWSTPTSTEDIATWLDMLLSKPAREVHGLLHVCNSGQASWLEYAQTVLDLAAELGLLPESPPARGHSMVGFAPFKAPRPRYTPMDNARLVALLGQPVRPWQEALRSHLAAFSSTNA